MPVVRETFVRNSVVFILIIAVCSATIQNVMTRFTVNKSVATSYTTLQKISKIECAIRCHKERQNGRCTLAGYNKATRTCYLSVDSTQDIIDTTDGTTGVIFFESDPLGCAAAGEPLLDGTNPVPDSYFTASSEHHFQNAAHNARLYSGDYGWVANEAERNAVPPKFYLQVRFHALSTVIRVATKGKSYWVTLYRLAYSEDCSTFTNLLDGAGNNVTFPANTDRVTVVENHLPTPIPVLCLRLFPLAFNVYPTLEMEVYGCPSA